MFLRVTWEDVRTAVAQVALMTGRPGPVAPMRAALEDAIAARA